MEESARWSRFGRWLFGRAQMLASLLYLAAFAALMVAVGVGLGLVGPQFGNVTVSSAPLLALVGGGLLVAAWLVAFLGLAAAGTAERIGTRRQRYLATTPVDPGISAAGSSSLARFRYADAAASTVEEATAAASAKLGLPVDDVNVELLVAPRRGVLGLGHRAARVRVRPTEAS